LGCFNFRCGVEISSTLSHIGLGLVLGRSVWVTFAKSTHRDTLLTNDSASSFSSPSLITSQIEPSSNPASPFTTNISPQQTLSPENTTPPFEPRRTSRQPRKPAWLNDFVAQAMSSPPKVSVLYPITKSLDSTHFSVDHKAFLSALDGESDPKFFHEVVKNPKWCDAMNLELRALEDNHTWSLTSLPLGKKAIGYKWLYKTKSNSDGIVERYKARLVVLGCRQEYGVDC